MSMLIPNIMSGTDKILKLFPGAGLNAGTGAGAGTSVSQGQGNKFKGHSMPSEKLCDGPLCANVKNLMKCKGCKISSYCSSQCQKDHWKSDHKRVCKRLDRNDKDSKN